MTPTGLQNGGQNGSKIALFGYWPKASWICYLLHLGHIGRSRGAPESHPKSSPIPEPLPDLIFPHFGRIWGAMWVAIWLHVRSFSDPIFAPIFERIFGWVGVGPGRSGEVPAPPAAWIPSRTGGGFLSGDPFSGFTGSISLIRRRQAEPDAADIQIQIQFGIDAAGRPATPAQGCAGWAWNPKGPQVTRVCHQTSRRGTI